MNDCWIIVFLISLKSSDDIRIIAQLRNIKKVRCRGLTRSRRRVAEGGSRRVTELLLLYLHGGGQTVQRFPAAP